MKHAMVGWCGKRRISHFFYYFLRVSVTEALVYAYEKKCLKKTAVRFFYERSLLIKLGKLKKKKFSHSYKYDENYRKGNLC